MTDQLLCTHLAFAVPLRIHELRDQPEWALEEIRAALPDRLQQGADSMQFGGGAPGDAALSVAAWTTALALLALTAWGGVTWQGLHWCRTPGCSNRDDLDAHPQPYPDAVRAPAPSRPVEDLPDLSLWEAPASP